MQDPARGPARHAPPADLPAAIASAAEPFAAIDDADLSALLQRIGDARVVLLGESTHGTSEFYRFRARLTRELVARHGFQIVAVEADWPDAARIDHWVRHAEHDPGEWRAFSRFPTWMWRNTEVRELVDWLHEHNRPLAPERRTGFYGLDMYSLYTSIEAVLHYLDDVDPAAALVARQRYGCLSPWEGDPATYGRAALGGGYRDCEAEVAEMLRDLLGKRMQYRVADGERFVDAVHNARLIASAEKYYKIMYYGGRQSWNLRDQHMFDTLKLLLDFRGPASRAVVWEHNSHVGDASATEMGGRGEHNVGQLCRAEWGEAVHIVGFGTDHGTVAAASHWDGEMEVKTVRPSHERSYERLAHRSGVPRFVLDLAHPQVHQGLLPPRLERAIGVIYRPETELASHYFQATLPRQFDDWVWFDETEAVTPLRTEHLAADGVPETYPFGL
jgi:erythromycin esterase-like protein